MFDKKVLLSIENCIAHGSFNSFPYLSNVEVLCVPPNTTLKLQPLDAGNIAALRMHYKLCHVEHNVDLADVGINDIYEVDILSAMT